MISWENVHEFEKVGGNLRIVFRVSN